MQNTGYYVWACYKCEWLRWANQEHADLKTNRGVLYNGGGIHLAGAPDMDKK